MRILILNPNSDMETNAVLKRKADSVLDPPHSAEVVCMKDTPKLISSWADCAAAAAELLRTAPVLERGYDALIVACHSDPGLEALRETCDKPVWGIGEASMRLAGFYGARMAVIATSARAFPRKYDAAKRYGCEGSLCCCVAAKSDEYGDLLAAGREALEKGANVLVLGCANYSYADGRLERELGVPVLDGLACALALAVGMNGYLKSKKA